MRPEKIYLVWQGHVDEKYYNQYGSLEDAVSSEEAPVRVYIAEPVLLGDFEVAVKIVKSKKKKAE